MKNFLPDNPSILKKELSSLSDSEFGRLRIAVAQEHSARQYQMLAEYAKYNQQLELLGGGMDKVNRP